MFIAFFQKHIPTIFAALGLFIYVIVVFLHWNKIEESTTVSSIVAGIFLLIITAILIPVYRNNFLNKPKIYIVDSISGTKYLKWHRSYVNNNDYKLSISIKNDGRLSLINKVFYQIFIPIPLNMEGSNVIINHFEGKEYELEKTSIEINGVKFIRIRGRTSGPIYSKSFLNFLEIHLKMNQNEYINQTMHYYLSTEFGYLPRSAYRFNDNYFKNKVFNFELLEDMQIKI